MVTRICVVGDTIVDRYVHGGDRQRRNPETGGRIVQVYSEEFRLGGAAAVAMIASEFGCRVQLISSVGDDIAGKFVLDELRSYGVNRDGVRVFSGGTTVKTRIVCDEVVLPIRLDCDVSSEPCLRVETDSDVILVADYNKGFVSRQTVVSAASLGREVIVDPYVDVPWDKYSGASIIKSNLLEFDHESERTKQTLASLANSMGCNIVVTRGSQGCTMAGKDGQIDISAHGDACVDVTGAGDTVLAALGATHGLNLRERCAFAMQAAAEQIQTIGIRAVSIKPPVYTCH